MDPRFKQVSVLFKELHGEIDDDSAWVLDELAEHCTIFSRRTKNSVCAEGTLLRAWFSSLNIDERLSVLTCTSKEFVDVVLDIAATNPPCPHCHRRAPVRVNVFQDVDINRLVHAGARALRGKTSKLSFTKRVYPPVRGRVCCDRQGPAWLHCVPAHSSDSVVSAAQELESHVRLFYTSATSMDLRQPRHHQRSHRARVRQRNGGNGRDSVSFSQQKLDGLSLSRGIVDDVANLFRIFEEASAGSFLSKVPKDIPTAWESNSNSNFELSATAEAPWLRGLGYYTLGSLLASRFEMYLWKAFLEMSSSQMEIVTLSKPPLSGKPINKKKTNVPKAPCVVNRVSCAKKLRARASSESTARAWKEMPAATRVRVLSRSLASTVREVAVTDMWGANHHQLNHLPEALRRLRTLYFAAFAASSDGCGISCVRIRCRDFTDRAGCFAVQSADENREIYPIKTSFSPHSHQIDDLFQSTCISNSLVEFFRMHPLCRGRSGQIFAECFSDYLENSIVEELTDRLLEEEEEKLHHDKCARDVAVTAVTESFPDAPNPPSKSQKKKKKKNKKKAENTIDPAKDQENSTSNIPASPPSDPRPVLFSPCTPPMSDGVQSEIAVDDTPLADRLSLTDSDENLNASTTSSRVRSGKKREKHPPRQIGTLTSTADFGTQKSIKSKVSRSLSGSIDVGGKVATPIGRGDNGSEGKSDAGIADVSDVDRSASRASETRTDANSTKSFVPGRLRVCSDSTDDRRENNPAESFSDVKVKATLDRSFPTGSSHSGAHVGKKRPGSAHAARFAKRVHRQSDSDTSTDENTAAVRRKNGPTSNESPKRRRRRSYSPPARPSEPTSSRDVSFSHPKPRTPQNLRNDFPSTHTLYAWVKHALPRRASSSPSSPGLNATPPPPPPSPCTTRPYSPQSVQHLSSVGCGPLSLAAASPGYESPRRLMSDESPRNAAASTRTIETSRCDENSSSLKHSEQIIEHSIAQNRGSPSDVGSGAGRKVTGRTTSQGYGGSTSVLGMLREGTKLLSEASENSDRTRAMSNAHVAGILRDRPVQGREIQGNISAVGTTTGNMHVHQVVAPSFEPFHDTRPHSQFHVHHNGYPGSQSNHYAPRHTFSEGFVYPPEGEVCIDRSRLLPDQHPVFAGAAHTLPPPGYLPSFPEHAPPTTYDFQYRPEITLTPPLTPGAYPYASSRLGLPDGFTAPPENPIHDSGYGMPRHPPPPPPPRHGESSIASDDGHALLAEIEMANLRGSSDDALPYVSTEGTYHPLPSVQGTCHTSTAVAGGRRGGEAHNGAAYLGDVFGGGGLFLWDATRTHVPAHCDDITNSEEFRNEVSGRLRSLLRRRSTSGSTCEDDPNGADDVSPNMSSGRLRSLARRRSMSSNNTQTGEDILGTESVGGSKEIEPPVFDNDILPMSSRSESFFSLWFDKLPKIYATCKDISTQTEPSLHSPSTTSMAATSSTPSAAFVTCPSQPAVNVTSVSTPTTQAPTSTGSIVHGASLQGTALLHSAPTSAQTVVQDYSTTQRATQPTCSPQSRNLQAGAHVPSKVEYDNTSCGPVEGEALASNKSFVPTLHSPRLQDSSSSRIVIPLSATWHSASRIRRGVPRSDDAAKRFGGHGGSGATGTARDNDVISEAMEKEYDELQGRGAGSSCVTPHQNVRPDGASHVHTNSNESRSPVCQSVANCGGDVIWQGVGDASTTGQIRITIRHDDASRGAYAILEKITSDDVSADNAGRAEVPSMASTGSSSETAYSLLASGHSLGAQVAAGVDPNTRATPDVEYVGVEYVGLLRPGADNVGSGAENVGLREFDAENVRLPRPGVENIGLHKPGTGQVNLDSLQTSNESLSDSGSLECPLRGMTADPEAELFTSPAGRDTSPEPNDPGSPPVSFPAGTPPSACTPPPAGTFYPAPALSPRCRLPVVIESESTTHLVSSPMPEPVTASKGRPSKSPLSPLSPTRERAMPPKCDSLSSAATPAVAPGHSARTTRQAVSLLPGETWETRESILKAGFSESDGETLSPTPDPGTCVSEATVREETQTEIEVTAPLKPLQAVSPLVEANTVPTRTSVHPAPNFVIQAKEAIQVPRYTTSSCDVSTTALDIQAAPVPRQAPQSLSVNDQADCLDNTKTEKDCPPIHTGGYHQCTRVSNSDTAHQKDAEINGGEDISLQACEGDDFVCERGKGMGTGG
eukprot:Rmarinus@m.9809